MQIFQSYTFFHLNLQYAGIATWIRADDYFSKQNGHVGHRYYNLFCDTFICKKVNQIRNTYQNLIIISRYKERFHTLSWADVYDKNFPMMMLVIDVLNCIPPTSVTCETTFSQMKLIKTSGRTRLRNSTLNNLLLVKLQSPGIGEFNPDSSIGKWMVILDLY